MELIPPNLNIDFMGKRHYAYLFTAAMMILALVSIPVKGHIQLGIDFSGGTMVQVKFNKAVHIDEVRDSLKGLSEGLTIQKFAAGGEEYLIRMEVPEEGTDQLARRIQEILDTKFGKGQSEIRSLEVVGPKVGRDLREAAVWATVIALALLLAYMVFRFTFSMGLGAVFCLVHDLIVVYGFFVWTGKEFNLTILAAMLTVIGYDINDSIVVCDRIRENLKTMKKQPLSQIMNDSINQTLSRTIMTAGFTLLVVISLIFFGTNVLRDFAWALMIGIIFGTYSSIFVASPLVLALDKYIPVKR